MFQRIQYNELNSRQKENFNFQKVASELADYGFNCMWLNDDWQGADFIACHINGNTFLNVQLKGRLTIDQKYSGKDIFVAFNQDNNWYIYPLDELFDCFVYPLVFIFLAWYFLKEEKAIISFSKHVDTIIEIRGVYPSIFGAIALILLATQMVSIIIDHFDRRENEHIYKVISSWLLRLSLMAIIVCIFIGWLTGNIHVVNT